MNQTIDRVALKKAAKKLLDGKVFKILFCYAIYGITVVGCFALCFLTPNPLSHYFVNMLETVQIISTIFTVNTLQLIVWGFFLFVRVVLFMALIHPFSVCIITVPIAIVESRAISWQDAVAPIRRLRYFIECMIAGAVQFLSTFFWTLLLIVPGVLTFYRYSFTKHLFIENNELTFGETAEKSRDLARNFEGQLFFLDLSFLGWLLFGICTGGIGLLYLICYYSVTKALYYKEIKRMHEAAASEGVDNSATSEDPAEKDSQPPQEEPTVEQMASAISVAPSQESAAPSPEQDTGETQPKDERPTDATLWTDSNDKGIRIARGDMTNLQSTAAQSSTENQEETK